MGPYSHYTLATRLEPSLQPENRKTYYWGAVAPDIRYLANMRREQTHLGLERINELKSYYPHLRSFLSGYQVHILTDQIDVSQAVGAAFQKIGWIQNLRIEKYMNAYRAMQKHKVMNSLLMLSIKNAGLDARVIEHMRSSLVG
jgi:hypothetical protein